MNLSWTRSLAAAEFVCTQAGLETPRDFGPMVAFVAHSGDDLCAAVLVHDWNQEAETVEISGAVKTPRAPIRKMARTVARYVFDEMGCQAAIWRTSEENKKARKIAQSMGGREYIIPRLRGRQASEALVIITQEAWMSSKWS